MVSALILHPRCIAAQPGKVALNLLCVFENHLLGVMSGGIEGAGVSCLLREKLVGHPGKPGKHHAKTEQQLAQDPGDVSYKSHTVQP